MPENPLRSGSVAAMLWEAAARHPDKAAVIERERSSTYEGLRDSAAGIAAGLAREGLRSGDRVAILLERGIPAVAAYFGVLAAGGIAVVLNEMLRPRQVENVPPCRR